MVFLRITPSSVREAHATFAKLVEAVGEGALEGPFVWLSREDIGCAGCLRAPGIGELVSRPIERGRHWDGALVDRQLLAVIVRSLDGAVSRIGSVASAQFCIRLLVPKYRSISLVQTVSMRVPQALRSSSR